MPPTDSVEHRGGEEDMGNGRRIVIVARALVKPKPTGGDRREGLHNYICAAGVQQKPDALNIIRRLHYTTNMIPRGGYIT